MAGMYVDAARPCRCGRRRVFSFSELDRGMMNSVDVRFLALMCGSKCRAMSRSCMAIRIGPHRSTERERG